MTDPFYLVLVIFSVSCCPIGGAEGAALARSRGDLAAAVDEMLAAEPPKRSKRVCHPPLWPP